MSLLSVRYCNLIKLVRFHEFETITEEGRSKERSRRIALTAITAGVARCSRILVSLISVPLLLRYLGDEQYGIWLAISSIVSMVNIADFGIGNGLISALAKCKGTGDEGLETEYVSSAFYGLTAIAIILGIFFISAINIIPWNWLLNLSSPQLLIEVKSAAVAIVLCFLIRFPLTVAGRIRRGLQEGYVTNYCDIFSSIIGLCGIIIAAKLGLGLTSFVIVLAGAPIAGHLINGFLVVLRDYRYLLPRPGKVNIKTTSSLFRVGWAFLGLQVCTLVAFETDILIVSRILGIENVPQYSVPMKLFMFIPMILTFVLAPLWPAYGEAIAKGDIGWVKKTLWRSVCTCTIVTSIGAVFLVIMAKPLLALWVGDTIDAHLIQRAALGFYIILATTTNAFTRFLQGIEAFRFLLITTGLMTIANLPISIVLTQIVGVSGPVWGSNIALLIFSLLPIIIYSRKSNFFSKSINLA